MDSWDSHCPYLLSSETTAKGTGLEESAGKEDPVELDSSPTLWNDLRGVEYAGGFAAHEIPQLSMLFYLFHDALSGALTGVQF